MATALRSLGTPDTEVVARRTVQHVLDVGVSSLIALPPILLLHLGRHSDSGSTAWAVLGGLLCGLLTLVWYWVLRPVRTGQTWGMRLLGIRVVKADRSPLTIKAALLRILLWPVDGLVCGLVGLIIMLLSPRRQRLGDVVAGTLVVRDRGALDGGGLAGAEAGWGSLVHTGDRLVLPSRE